MFRETYSCCPPRNPIDHAKGCPAHAHYRERMLPACAAEEVGADYITIIIIITTINNHNNNDDNNIAITITIRVTGGLSPLRLQPQVY